LAPQLSASTPASLNPALAPGPGARGSEWSAFKVG